MKNLKIFQFIVIFYFIFSGFFHFLRLAFDWKIIIVGNQRDYSVSTLVSALAFLFSVFIVFWIYRIKKEEQKKIIVNNIEETNKEEEE
jgi:hypothetical protein